jgi:LmbE family N-acetylglucosaminyl deacetylase
MVSRSRTSDVLLLGYPNLRLQAVAAATEPITEDAAGLHRTWAARGDGAGCDGDLRFRLDGRHGELDARSLAADLDAVLALARPTDVYTHVVFDGHPDHAEVFRQVEAALGRGAFAGTLHTTLIHPDGTASCMGPSAERWPNPPLLDGNPFARFTPALDVTAPPVPPCDGPTPASTGVRPVRPTSSVPVPPDMQREQPDQNLKWQVIARYASQVDCTKRASGYHASCGYMRAFVKRTSSSGPAAAAPPPAAPCSSSPRIRTTKRSARPASSPARALPAAVRWSRSSRTATPFHDRPIVRAYARNT